MSVVAIFFHFLFRVASAAIVEPHNLYCARFNFVSAQDNATVHVEVDF